MDTKILKKVLKTHQIRCFNRFCSKFTTGLLLKQLEEEHKININDPVSKYIPWFKTSKPIPLKDLMLHQSGLYKYKSSKDYKNLDQAVRAIQKRGIDPKKYKKSICTMMEII